MDAGERLPADRFASVRRPTPAPADPPPQPERPRTIETSPAAEHTVTRRQELPVRRPWRMLAPALVFGALAGDQLGQAGDGWVYLLAGVVVLVIALLSLWSLVVDTERRRTLALLRRHPWVEYPAEVRLRSGDTKGALAIVELDLGEGRHATYRTYPPETDYQLGPRPVWCAGVPGRGPVAVSLKKGACVSWARRTG